MRGQPSLPHDRCKQGEEEDRNGVKDLQANAHQCSEEEHEEHGIDKTFAIALCDAQVGDETEQVEKQEDRTCHGEYTDEQIGEDGSHPCHDHKHDTQQQDRTSWKTSAIKVGKPVWQSIRSRRGVDEP